MLIQCQLDLVADTMARDCYKQEAEKLCEKLSLARQQQDALLTLHRKIQDFQELAVSSLSFVFCCLCWGGWGEDSSAAALNQLPWKDEKQPWSVIPTLELYQKQHSGNS